MGVVQRSTTSNDLGYRRLQPVSVSTVTTLRMALRGLRKAPWFAATTTVLLAMGIALATASFAVVDGTLFRALPYDRPVELFALRAENNATPRGSLAPLAAPEIERWVTAVSELPSTTIGARLEDFPVDGIAASLATVDAGFFDVLGVQPLLGGFSPEDFDEGSDEAARTANRPVIVSHRLWRTWLGEDRQALGRTWTVSERRGRVFSVRIAGVLPANFVFPLDPGGESPDLIAPLGRLSRLGTRRAYYVLFRVGSHVDAAGVMGRLDAATKDVSRLQLPSDQHGSHGEQKLLAPFDRVTLQPVNRLVASRQRSSFALLFVAALGLLLLACFNTAGLIMARSIERRNQLSTCRALGATGWHLAGLQLAETAALVGAATLLGLILAQPLLAQTLAVLPESMRVGETPAINTRAACAAILFAVAAILAVAAWPVFVITRADGRSRHSPRFARMQPGRVGVVFLSVQVACGFIFLIGGVLTSASLGAAMKNDVGYERDRMLLLEASVRKYVSADDARRQLEESVDLLHRLPGVERVAVSTIQATFLRPITSRTPITPEGWTKPAPDATVRQVSETFFDVMGLRLVAGRWPESGEWLDNAPAAIVSETAARVFWPDGRAVGRNLQTEKAGAKTVIGVVADARFAGLDILPTQDVYLPNPIALGRTGLLYHVKASGSADDALRSVIRELATRGLRVDRAATHSRGLFGSIKDRALPAWLFGLLGAAALVVLALGIFGLLAMATAQRTQEVGIRLALGCTKAGIIGVILREPLIAVIDGLAVGGLISWWLVTFLDAQLYGVRSHQPGLWAIAVLTLILVALAAAAAPALRATRVNPLDTLRAE
jgi:predicted permease